MNQLNKKQLIIGTRGSALALWQAHYTQTQLTKLGYDSTLKIIETKGDAIQNLSFDKLEGKGFFTKEIEDALLNFEIDIAVHSHKDLPTLNPTGLEIAAVSYRANPSDTILIRKESYEATKDLFVKENAVIGTSSPRRNQQLQLYRKDILIKDLRGNVDTRINKLKKGMYDAIVLATAGLERLQIDTTALICIHLDCKKIIPAPAQGVLAWQIRVDDERLQSVCKQLNNEHTAAEIGIERRLLNQLEGGCRVACGVYCTKIENIFHAFSFYVNETTNRVVRFSNNGENQNSIIEQHFEILKQNEQRLPIFISSTVAKNSYIANVAQRNDWKLQAQTLLTLTAIEAPIIEDYDAVYFTSKKGVDFFLAQHPTACIDKVVACFGTETQSHLKKYGIESVIINAKETKELAAFNRLKIMFPQAKNSMKTAQKIVASVATSIDLVVYDNQASTDNKVQPHDIALLTSPLNVVAYFEQKIRATAYIAIGNSTAEALRNQGIEQCFVCTTPAEEHWADAIFHATYMLHQSSK